MASQPDPIHHFLVAAHADRIAELDALGGSALVAAIERWAQADLAAEEAERFTLSVADLAELRAGVALAAHLARTYGPEDGERDVLLAALEADASTSFSSLAVARRVRFRRSVARARRLEALRGPGFALWSEAQMIQSLLSPAAPWTGESWLRDPARERHVVWRAAFEACFVRGPGMSTTPNLGLGETDALTAHFAIPTRRIEVPSAMKEGSRSPIGWASGGELEAFVRKLHHHARASSIAERVDALLQSGHACIAWIEPMPPEAEGHSTFPVGDEDAG